MWLITQAAWGLILGSLFVVRDVMSLPTNFRSADVWSVVGSSSTKVQLQSKHLRREELVHHRPARAALPSESPLPRAQPDLLFGPRQRLSRSRPGVSVHVDSLPPEQKTLRPVTPYSSHPLHSNITVEKVQRKPRHLRTKELVLHEVAKKVQRSWLPPQNDKPEVLVGSIFGLAQLGSKVMQEVNLTTLIRPVTLYASSSIGSSLMLERVLALGFVAIVVLALLFTFCFADESANLSGSTQVQQALRSPDVLEEKHEDSKKANARERDKRNMTSAGRTANTKANLLKLEATQSHGTWATTYRDADEGIREALELLFRCNIIPTQEFAHSYVGQQHIDECVWISTQMLRQNSLEEWVEIWPQAMKTFEESVTACFAARTDVIANLLPVGASAPNSPNSPRSGRGIVDCRTPHMERSPSASGANPRSNLSTMNSLTEEDAPSPTSHPHRAFFASLLGHAPAPADRTAAQVREPTNASSNVPKTSSLSEVLGPRNEEFQKVVGDERGRSSVVARCREIMRETPPHAGLQVQSQKQSSLPAPAQPHLAQIAESPRPDSDSGPLRGLDSATSTTLKKSIASIMKAASRGDASSKNPVEDSAASGGISSTPSFGRHEDPTVAKSSDSLGSTDPFKSSPHLEGPFKTSPNSRTSLSAESYGVPVRLSVHEVGSASLPSRGDAQSSLTSETRWGVSSVSGQGNQPSTHLEEYAESLASSVQRQSTAPAR